MIKPGKGLGSLAELLTQLGEELQIGGWFGVIFLNNAGELKARVLGQIDSAHAALSEQVKNLVAALQELAWKKWHAGSKLKLRQEIRGGQLLRLHDNHTDVILTPRLIGPAHHFIAGRLRIGIG